MTRTDALLDEVLRLRVLLAVTRLHYANLLAAARATLGAAEDSEDDPLFYLRDELAMHPSPPDGTAPAAGGSR
jgi:hypothetical protein